MLNSRTHKVLALSVGQTLTTVVGIISAAVLSRVLSTHDYATYRQTLLAYAFSAPLLTLALPQALYFFLPGEKKRQRGLLVDNLILLSVMGLLFSIILFLGGNRLLAWRFNNPELTQSLKLFAPYPLFMLPMGAIGACLVVQEKIGLLSLYNVLSRLFIVISIIVAGILWKNPIAPLLSNVVTVALACMVALFLMFSVMPKDSWYPSRASMKAMLKYSVPLGFASMLGTISLQLDKVVVASMRTPEDFAVYSNGAFEIPLIGIITGSIAAVILADMRKAVIQGNEAESLRLFRKAAVKSALIILPVMFFLMVFAEDVIVLLYSDKYLGSVLPFRLYLLILPARIVYYGAALMALGLTKVVLLRSIFDLLINAILSIVLVYMLGSLGAVVATIATIYLWAIPFNLNHIAKGFKCRYQEPIPWGDVSRLMLAAAIAAGISALLLLTRLQDGGGRILIGLLMYGVTYIGCGYMLKTEFCDIVPACYSRILAWYKFSG